MSDTENLVADILSMAGAIGANFIKLGRALRRLQDMDQKLYERTVRDAALTPQSAGYLVRIDRAFANLPVSASRLQTIGWIKLASIAPYVSRENYHVLLTKAEQINETELEMMLRGETLDGAHQAVTFRLRPDEVQTLNSILLSFGATEVDGRYTNREAALMELAWCGHRLVESLPIEGDDDDFPDDMDEEDEFRMVEIKVTGTLEERQDRLLKLLAKVRAERDELCPFRGAPSEQRAWPGRLHLAVPKVEAATGALRFQRPPCRRHCHALRKSQSAA